MSNPIEKTLRKKAELAKLGGKSYSYKETLGILKTLQSKAGNLNKKPTNVKPGIVAKHIESKQKIKNEGHLAYDLEDF